jgi:hypothetical protein
MLGSRPPVPAARPCPETTTVVQAALTGLRDAFTLDTLVVAVPVAGADLLFWGDETSSVADAGPELEVARAELAKLFDTDRPAARWGHYRWVRGRYLWLRGPVSRSGPDRFGVAAARRTRLSPVESTLLSDLCRAVVWFHVGQGDIGVDRAEMAAKTVVRVRSRAGGVVAEVHATWALPEDNRDASAPQSPPRRVGLGKAADAITAVARAAAKAARPRCEVVHAGVIDPTAAGGANVAVVRAVALIRTIDGQLRLGVGDGPPSADRPELFAVALAVLGASLVADQPGNAMNLTPA